MLMTDDPVQQPYDVEPHPQLLPPMSIIAIFEYGQHP
jgi:hypothetical protein